MPKLSRSKCGEFQDGNFKITKIHKERRYPVLFFNAAVVAAVASDPKYMYYVRYTRRTHDVHVHNSEKSCDRR